jgi:hypothetical protein
MDDQKKEIKLKINDSELRGIYANQIAIMHSKYDFVLDFISMFPPEAIVNSRIIMTPASLKRISGAIAVNLKKYEDEYGTIEIEDDPNNDVIGKVN